MTDRDDIAVPDEQVRLAEGDAPCNDLRGARDDEQRVAILLDLRTLMRLAGILDGQLMQAELRLDPRQQLVARLEQADPDDVARLFRPLAGFVDGDVGNAPTAGIHTGCNNTGLWRIVSCAPPARPARPSLFSGCSSSQGFSSTFGRPTSQTTTCMMDH